MAETKWKTAARLRKHLALVAVLTIVLAACGDGGETADTADTTDTTAPETTDTTAPDTAAGDATTVPAITGRCGDPDRLGTSFNFYNWADYIDPEVLAMFEAECGVSVTMDTYTSNEEALAKIQAGNSGYSLMIPTGYMAEILFEQGLALELDHSLIPNVDNIDPQQLGQFYDPDDIFSLPYQYGTTALAYNVNSFDTPPTSYAVLFDENQHCGQSSLLEDLHETMGAALQYLGYSFNSEDRAELEEAGELLIESKDCISAFDSANYIGNLASGEVVVAHSWSFAAGIARLDNPDVAYVVPDEGGVLWQDTFVIPADAPDPYTAHVFINYMLEPDIGALITEFTFGFTPNLEVEPLLSADYHEIITDGGIAIDADVRERLEDLRHSAADLKAELWREVLAR
jgi:spermidine/putrescine transport system substrate-binding protein